MENELRKDYILDRWVIIATGRSKRPDDFKKSREYKPDAKICFFCPGNESTTPPEIKRVGDSVKWSIRVFPNKFPALTLEGGKARGDMIPAYGEHEVIVETPDHGKGLADLTTEELTDVLNVYAEREEALLNRKGVKYALIFKNWGREAGASLEHTHTQIVSMPLVPKLVLEETKAASKYRREKGSCPFCTTIKKEMRSERKVIDEKDIAVFTPYASRVPMEVWIIPKRHVGKISELKPEERKSLAKALKQVLGKLKQLDDAPYNYYVHSSPQKGGLHLHIEVLPKLAVWAGFELGSEVYINTLTPEFAAEYYRR